MIRQRNLLPVLLVPTGLLLIPAAAMWFQADGWAWSTGDFVIAWLFLAGAIGAYQLVASQSGQRTYRAGAGLAVATGLVLLWINGAVGLIGSEDNPANLLYAGVLLVGGVGAWIARLRPMGMAWALLATALAQFLVPIIAWIVWRPDFSPGVIKVFLLNFVFVLLFAGAADLFRLAGRGARPD